LSGSNPEGWNDTALCSIHKNVRRGKKMKQGEIKYVLNPCGNSNKAGANSIDFVERELQKGIAERSRPYHYDELCRYGTAGFVFNKVKPIRNESGHIDILATFTLARKRTCLFESNLCNIKYRE